MRCQLGHLTSLLLCGLAAAQDLPDVINEPEDGSPTPTSDASATLPNPMDATSFLAPTATLSLPDPMDAPPAAVFAHEIEPSKRLVFALSANESSSDLFVHMSYPSSHAWGAVGIGKQMEGSLMFIAYQSANENGGVTKSLRLGHGHTEPEPYDEKLSTEDEGSGNENSVDQKEGMVTMEGICRECSQYMGENELDFGSEGQDFIFALGPEEDMESDSIDAGLRRHELHGHFTLDMTLAASTTDGEARIPSGPFEESRGASDEQNVHSDGYDSAPAVHGVLMCIVFLLLYPGGAVWLRLWGRIAVHISMQALASTVFLIALIIGAHFAQYYRKSKDFNSAHQIIGILLLIAIVFQLTLGSLHHRIFKREGLKSLFGKIHRYLGPGIMIFGVINGGLGIKFADDSRLAIPYIIVVIVLSLLFAAVRTGILFWRKRHNPAPKHAAPEPYLNPLDAGESGASGMPYDGSRGMGGAGSSNTWAPPPPYGHDVPLTPMEGSAYGQHDDFGMRAPVQPKGMI